MKGLLTHCVAVAILVTSVRADVPYCVEAEDVVVNRDAWVKDVSAKDKWNLWSTDRDADKKWSGGVVLRSPLVMEDRQSPAEGGAASPGPDRGACFRAGILPDSEVRARSRDLPGWERKLATIHERRSDSGRQSHERSHRVVCR